MVTSTDLTRPRTIEGITRPDPRHHFGQIFSWIVCWPWNLLWTLVVHNPLRYIFQFALHEIQSTLDEIATGEFSEIARDMDDRVPDVTPPAVSSSVSAREPESSAPAAKFPVVSAATATIRPPQVEDSVLETIDENAFVATSMEQSSVETVEETPEWSALLKQGSTGEAVSSGNSLETYTPPAMPPIHEPDPWYFAPGMRGHDPRTSESN